MQAIPHPQAGEPPISTKVLVIQADDPAVLDAIRAALPQVRAGLPQGCQLNVRLIHGPPIAEGGQGVFASLPALTSRQHDILDLLATGLSNKEIGRKLDLSHFTVRNHISQIMRLMGVSTRQEIITAMAAGAHKASFGRSERYGQHEL